MSRRSGPVTSKQQQCHRCSALTDHTDLTGTPQCERCAKTVSKQARQSSRSEEQASLADINDQDDDGRPEDCCCVPALARAGMPCWPCYRDGHDAPDVEEVDAE